MPNVPNEGSALPDIIASVGGEYDVKIIDGQPEMVVDLETTARLIKHSPLGEVEATRRMRAALPSHIFAKVEAYL